MMKRFLIPALLVAWAVGTAKAGSVSGSLAFLDVGKTSVNTGDINTSTTFAFGDLVTSQNSSGIFAGPGTSLTDQNFGATSFSAGWALNDSFSISSAAFGTFKSTSISQPVNTPGLVVFSVVGNYTGGAFDPSVKDVSGTFTFTFTQDPAHTGVISGAGVFGIGASPAAGGSDPPLVVPEPATLVMGLTSFVGGGLFYLLRRRRSSKATL
jgi:hypothetical protein